MGSSFTGINGNPDDTYIGGTVNYSGILSGYDNRNNGLACIMATQHGRIYTAATHVGIFGGSYHNVIDGDYIGILGGTLNTHSSSGANSAFLGGSYHTVSGTAAGAAMVGGYGCAISANYSAAIASYSCTLSAASTAAIAAQEVTVSAVFAVGFGWQTSNYIQGSLTYGCRRHSANGDSQAISFHESQSTTDAGTADLSPYGSANLVSLPANTTWAGTAFVAGIRTSDGATCAYRIDFCVYKRGGNIVVGGTPTVTTLYDGITITTPPAINPTSSGSFRIRCTGIAAAGTIRWSSRVDVVSITA